jgi:hypothetical protein
VVSPIIGLAGPGVELTVTVRLVNPLVSQLFAAFTVTLPEVGPIVVDIDTVPWPELIVAPVGTVQIYPVAPETAVIE